MGGATTTVVMDGKTYEVPRRTAAASATRAEAAAESEEAAAHVPPAVSAAEAVDLGLIRESETNPRRNFGDLDELAASIRQHGVLAPVLLRAGNGSEPFELVCGARRLRAARLAGLTAIPAVLRRLSDEEAIEAQLVENCQRKDVEALEEADGLRDLRDNHGYNVDRLVKRTGKSKAYVYARLKLAELGPLARAALENEAISPSVALLVARHPLAEQERALDLVLAHAAERDDCGMGYRGAARELKHELTRDLAEAPFDTAQCAACPQRAANCHGLFEEADADVCTDRACYNGKAEDAWQAAAARWREKGCHVLTRAESRVAMPHHSADFGLKGYVALASRCGKDPNARTYKKLLGKRVAGHVAVGVVREGPAGFEPVELLATKDAKRLLVEAGHDFDRPQAREEKQTNPTPGRWDIRDRAAPKIACATAAAVERASADDAEPVMRWLVRRYLGACGWKVDVERRGWLTGKDARREARIRQCLTDRCATEPLPVLFGLAAEVLLTDMWSDEMEENDPYLSVLGVDVKGLTKAACAELQAEREAAASKSAKKSKKKRAAPKASAKKKPSRKPAAVIAPAHVCRDCGCTDDDCRQCIEKTGEPCTWVEPDLCSACAQPVGEE